MLFGTQAKIVNEFIHWCGKFDDLAEHEVEELLIRFSEHLRQQ